jgi:hypothetical protein
MMNPCALIWGFLLLALILPANARGQSPVVVHIGPNTDGHVIPEDFCGLSFESSNLLPDKQGKYLFSGDNADLIALFRAIGIRNLRIGGGTADLPQYRIPTPPDIDHFFAFAQAANVKIIYTLRLLNGNAKDDAEIARYIQQRYASYLVCFEIGNEPDWHSFHTSPGHRVDPSIVESISSNPGSAFPSFLTDWNAFASAIIAAAPSAKFTGPDTGSNHPVPGTRDTDFNGQSWTWHFARSQKKSGSLLFVAQHDYVGQSASGVNSSDAIASMLSRDWPAKRYPLLFNHVLGPVQKEDISYRMTEANDYTGGVDGASNCYASALWALDYLHWHAAHHAVGVNFHNKRWIFTDTILPDPSGKLGFNPKAYAIEAFEVGGHGSPVPVSIDNGNDVNLTAYAVRDHQILFVTLINKEFGSAAHGAAVTIRFTGLSGRAAGMTLKSQGGNVAAKDGISFGGAAISSGGWNGQWADLGPCANDRVQVQVAPASAVVLKLDLK